MRRPGPRAFGGVLAAFLAVASFSCRDFSDAKAERLVRRYNEKLIEAYRTGDERFVEGLVGDAEAKKILGLVGVKSDMGITLDATLKELRPIRVERPSRETIDVLTEERWHYRDRKIGTGETVGEESDDHYFMRYTLRKQKDGWVVFRVSFDRPPEVGRTSAPIRAEVRQLHGLPPRPSTGPEPEERKGSR